MNELLLHYNMSGIDLTICRGPASAATHIHSILLNLLQFYTFSAMLITECEAAGTWLAIRRITNKVRFTAFTLTTLTSANTLVWLAWYTVYNV